MIAADLLELSAVEAIGAMQSGSVTAEEYALALLAQCERGQVLNAFIALDADQVLVAARAADQLRKSGGELGPLHGLPIPVKDSVNTRDLPTTAGTPALRNFHPKEDAPIVQTLRRAGAIVLGKTNLHELSMGWTSNNLAFGPVRNPYDPARIAGGSSGGTAAAVAARMAPLGVAEDTEGSIRVPAALCGIAGFRPTTYRYSSAGVTPISELFDQVGPHARTVGDLVLFDSVATGDFNAVSAGALKGVKLGVARDYFYSDLHPEVERIVEAALRRLEDAGVDLVEAEAAELEDLVQRTAAPIQAHDILRTLPEYLQDSGAAVTFDELVALSSPDVKAFFTEFSSGGTGFVSEEVYRAACEIYVPKLKKAFREYFARTGVTALVFPTTMTPATLIGDEDDLTLGQKRLSFFTAISRNISPGSTAALPGLVIPAGLTSNGLPVALEFDGPTGSDRGLLALGLSVESVLGRLAPPPLFLN